MCHAWGKLPASSFHGFQPLHWQLSSVMQQQQQSYCDSAAACQKFKLLILVCPQSLALPAGWQADGTKDEWPLLGIWKSQTKPRLCSNFAMSN
jgi:hypothetical protein